MNPPAADNTFNQGGPSADRAPREGWTDIDLAAYLDAELPPEQTALLASALRIDPALRERLTALRAADAAVLAFSSARRVESRPRVRRSRDATGAWPLPLGLALAATVVLALTVWLVLGPRGAGPIQTGPTSRIAAEPAADGPLPADHSGSDLAFGDEASERLNLTESPAGLIRVSLGVVRARPGTSMSGLAGPPAPGAGLRRAQPLRTPGAGTTGASTARPALAAAGTPSQDPMLVIARGVRSREEGLAVLDLLDPAAQVRACSAWASETRTRPIAFERLAQLAGDPAGAVEARRAIRSLAAREEFVPWLRMHGLMPDQSTASNHRTMQ